MSDMTNELTLHRISVAQYHVMAEKGIVAEDDRVELLDGLLVDMSPIGRAHWLGHAELMRYLIRVFGDRALVAGQLTLPLGDFSEPQPDIVVFAPRSAEYRRREPLVEEVFAVIEIADSSLSKDTGFKRDLYARSGVREYLVVDLTNELLRRFTKPTEGSFAQVEQLKSGATFSLEALTDVALEVDAFLPPRA